MYYSNRNQHVGKDKKNLILSHKQHELFSLPTLPENSCSYSCRNVQNGNHSPGIVNFLLKYDIHTAKCPYYTAWWSFTCVHLCNFLPVQDIKHLIGYHFVVWFFNLMS